MSTKNVLKMSAVREHIYRSLFLMSWLGPYNILLATLIWFRERDSNQNQKSSITTFFVLSSFWFNWHEGCVLELLQLDLKSYICTFDVCHHLVASREMTDVGMHENRGNDTSLYHAL